MVQYFPIVTGSLTVTGSVLVSGSITTNSTITATTLVVQTVTSSNSQISGSTKFGTLVSDNHQFTGSIYTSGSVGIGTSSINAWTNPFTVIQGGTFGQHIGFQSNAPDIKLGTNNFYNGSGYVYATSGSGAAQINVGGTSGFQVNLAPSGNTGATIPFTASLSIAQSGAATFSSTIQSADAIRILTGANTTDISYAVGKELSTNNAAFFGWRFNSGGTPYGFISVFGTSGRFSLMPDGGLVGIGTTNPADGLTIETNSNNFNALALRDSRAYNTSPEAALAFRLKYNSAGAYATPALFVAYKDNTTDGNQAGGIAFYTNPNSNVNERMRITSSGKIGMGVTNPEYLLDVADSSSNTLMAVRNTNTASSTAKNAMYGFLGTDTVGTVKAVGGMQAVTNDVNWISGNLYWYVRSGDAQPLRMSLSSGGALVISGALTQNGSPSDINLKENLVKISSPLNKISQINGYTFEWKEGTPARGNISNIVEDAGVVAQEIETILPEIVRTSDDNKVVNYNGITALLIEAIKELNTKFEEYKATHP